MVETSLIVCCGPISSGTRLITAIVSVDLGFGQRARHTSLPSGPNGMPPGKDDGSPLQWWDWRDWGPDASFVVIVRNPEFVVRSVMARTDIPYVPKDPLLIMEMYRKAIETLSDIPRAYWMSYEALVADQEDELGRLAAWLDVPLREHRKVVDGNAKHRHPGPVAR